jgi:hypothetical protein
MKKLLLPIAFVICTSFTVDSVGYFNISDTINKNETIVSKSKVSKFEIGVSEVEYSRNIDGKDYLNEKRSTDTEYTIDLKSKSVLVNHSDGTTVKFDSVSVSEKNDIYEVSYFDEDIYGNISKIYSTIHIDKNNNEVTYTEVNLDDKNDFNLYRFTKFEIKVD